MANEIPKHFLVPKHLKVSEAEKQKVLENYHVEMKDLPKIMRSDPAIAKLPLKIGDLIKVERVSKTVGVSSYYRVVVDG